MVENLGMDPEDVMLIRDNVREYNSQFFQLFNIQVNVVIHSAATVKFDEHLRAAVTMNVIGTKRIIDLCHQIKDLKVTEKTTCLRKIVFLRYWCMCQLHMQTATGLKQRKK